MMCASDTSLSHSFGLCVSLPLALPLWVMWIACEDVISWKHLDSPPENWPVNHH